MLGQIRVAGRKERFGSGEQYMDGFVWRLAQPRWEAL